MALFVHCTVLMTVTLFSMIIAASNVAAIDLNPVGSDAFLTAHNDVRASFDVSPLEWATPLASKAQEWANGCKFKSTGGSLSAVPYGENIAAGAGQFTIKDVVQLFTRDYVDFQANNTFTHFTQVVWKSTTHLGCGTALCDGIFDPVYGKATYYVCLYYPPGNVVGDQPENVPSLKPEPLSHCGLLCKILNAKHIARSLLALSNNLYNDVVHL